MCQTFEKCPFPKPNLKKKEKIALGILAKDKDITIVPADKGRAIVVMNTSDYQSKAKTLLDDTSTYQKMKKDPTPKFSNNLIGQLKELKKKAHLMKETTAESTPHPL